MYIRYSLDYLFLLIYQAMFTSNLAESQQEHITLNGVDATSASLLLEYAYTSTININSQNVQVCYT